MHRCPTLFFRRKNSVGHRFSFEGSDASWENRRLDKGFVEHAPRLASGDAMHGITPSVHFLRTLFPYEAPGKNVRHQSRCWWSQRTGGTLPQSDESHRPVLSTVMFCVCPCTVLSTFMRIE